MFKPPNFFGFNIWRHNYIGIIFEVYGPTLAYLFGRCFSSFPAWSRPLSASHFSREIRVKIHLFTCIRLHVSYSVIVCRVLYVYTDCECNKRSNFRKEPFPTCKLYSVWPVR
uniref:Ovule protein n=1 Tax=Bursaphelenchus xylophilus TaxID=6326 RepID=A0A1I7RHS2_BURXY